MPDHNETVDRRKFLGDGVRVAGAMGLGGLTGILVCRDSRTGDFVWQIDPDKCIACRNCEEYCVLDVSAVKAVQCFPLCGYCDNCPGYFDTAVHTTAAENLLCPTEAIRRMFIEPRGDQRHFEYTIDETKCVGCGKCVAGCAQMNGSLYLQIRHDRCVNCNECAIAVACPTEAIRRVPRCEAYLLKEEARKAIEAHELKKARRTGRKTPDRAEAKVEEP